MSMHVADTYIGNKSENDAIERRVQSEGYKTVAVTDDQRRRSRFRTTAEDGTEIGVVVGRELQAGDVLSDGEMYVVVTLESGVLWLHIAAGVVALLAGATALATTKGGPRHRRAGKTFVWAMAVVVGTVLPLLVIDPTSTRVFLTLVAVFSGYLAFSGYRVLSRKRPADGDAAVDWVAAGLVVAACLALGGWGVRRLLGGDPFGVVLVVFGGIGVAFGGVDARSFRAGGGEPEWTVTHLTRMVAALIATVTAVSAVNLTMLPDVVAWLWPTVAGSLLIAYYANRYGSG